MSDDVRDGRSRFGYCSVCAMQRQIRSDGNVRLHGPVAYRCPGSGLPPRTVPPPLPPSQPSSPSSESPPNSEILNPGRVPFKVLPRIPRAVRDQVARKLSEIIDLVVSSNSREAWEELFLFCRKNLYTPQRRGHRRSLVSHVRRAISDNTIPTFSSHQTFQVSSDPLKNLATRVAAKLEEGDFRGAVRIASSDESFAPDTSITLDLLRDKHPPQHTLSLIPPQQNNTICVNVSSSDVVNAIRSFPAGSAGGPDGLRPQHLKDLLLGRSGLGPTLLLDSITRFINFVVEGNVPPDAGPYFFGACLVALNKSTGGIRPIAVGCTLRRLVAKCSSSIVRDEMGDLLAPLQLGYGTPLGAEAAVHAARRYVGNLQPGQLLLKVDFRNAFNCLRRDKMLQSVLSHAPALYQFVHSAYSQPSLLFFGNNIIQSAEGVQQGDPLGPLLFSLAIHHLILSLRSEFRIFYLDDGTIGGSLDEVTADLKKIELSCKELGLVLNHSKSEVICSDDDTKCAILEVSPQLQYINPSDACLLGAPIGGPQSIIAALTAKKKTLERLGERLKLLHSHDALCLLRNALSLPKILYVLRASPCFLASSLLSDLDDIQRSLLEAICNVSLNDVAWRQASLPISAGGLGIRRFAMLATSAFLASAAGSSLLSQEILPPSLANTTCPFVEEAQTLWSQGQPADPPSGADASKQKIWDSAHIEAEYSSLLSTADELSRGRLLASRRKEAGVWLCAPPVSSLGLRMEDDTVRIAVGLRLGAPLCSPHMCTQCGYEVDASGTHGLHCRRSAGRHPRHAALNTLIKNTLVSVDIPSILEPSGLFRSDGKRVDGVTVVPWKSGRALAWDVTCSDIFAPSNSSAAASGTSIVARRSEERKKALYRELESSHIFVPIAIETSGVFGDEAMRFLKEVGHRIRSMTQDPQSFHYLCQQISVCVQKFNSVCVLGSC